MFEQAILNTVKSVGCNTISDGKYTCAYEELPGIFETIDAFMASHGILPGDCLSFRCGNTLPGAIMLLWLLYRERNFVLLPRFLTGKAQGELEDSNLPSFCKYKLTCPSPCDGRGSVIDFKYPVSYMISYPILLITKRRKKCPANIDCR